MSHKAISILEIKAVSEERRVITGMATTPTPDRVGDVVEPMGATFRKELPLLWMHDHRTPVGTVKFGKPTAEGIPFEATIPTVSEPSGLKARLDEAWASVKTRLVAAVSIGFRALEYNVITETGGLRFTKTEIFELSLVTVPANADATIETFKGLIAQAAAGNGEGGMVTKTVKSAVTSAPIPATSHVVKIKSVETKDQTVMKFSEQIKAFEGTAKLRLKEMEDIMSAAPGESLSEDQQRAYDEAQADVESAQAQIKRLKGLVSLQASVGGNVTEIDETAGATEKGAAAARGGSVTVKAKETLEAGIEFARYAMCLTAAKGDHAKALNLAKQHYPKSERIINALTMEASGANFGMIGKAAVQAGSTGVGGTTTWGQQLVDYQNFAGDFVEFLRPRTILGQFGRNGIPSLRNVPFNVRIAGQATGATAQWVGEGKAKPLTNPTYNEVNLGFAKIAAITVLTDELIRFSDPNAERLVRDELVAAVIERADSDFIDPTRAGVAGVSPASITYGITGIPSSGNDADAIREDVKNLWASFIQAGNAPRNGVYIMSSITALSLSLLQSPLGQSEFPGLTINGGTFMGVPAIVSDYVVGDTTGGMVVLVNASDIWLADDGQVVLDASREASLEMATNPTGDSKAPTAAQLVSMWQTNSVAIKAERYINWQRRRDSGVAYLTGVNWGNPE